MCYGVTRFLQPHLGGVLTIPPSGLPGTSRGMGLRAAQSVAWGVLSDHSALLDVCIVCWFTPLFLLNKYNAIQHPSSVGGVSTACGEPFTPLGRKREALHNITGGCAINIFFQLSPLFATFSPAVLALMSDGAPDWDFWNRAASGASNLNMQTGFSGVVLEDTSRNRTVACTMWHTLRSPRARIRVDNWSKQPCVGYCFKKAVVMDKCSRVKVSCSHAPQPNASQPSSLKSPIQPCAPLPEARGWQGGYISQLLPGWPTPKSTQS